MYYINKILFEDKEVAMPSTTEAFAETWKHKEHEQSAGLFCPVEWLAPVHAALTLMSHVDPGFQIHQVKEKFDRLRIYYECSPGLPAETCAVMHVIVSWAENQVDAIERSKAGADPLDPTTPIETVDAQLREMGHDPEAEAEAEKGWAIAKAARNAADLERGE